MHNSHSPFGANSPFITSICLDLTSPFNPHAASVTQRLGTMASPTPTIIPEKFSDSLRTIIAEHEEVTPDNVFVGNGRSAILHQLFSSLSPQQVLLIGPVPQEYSHILEQQQIPFVQIPLMLEDALVATPQTLQMLQETKADLAIFSSPNYYTGTPITGLQAIFSILRTPRVLIDTSLQEFLYPAPAYDEQRYRPYLYSLRPGTTLFMLNELNAFFSCPGICLAYLLGDKHPITNIQRQSAPYTVTTYSQTLGELLFQHLDDYRATLTPLTADVTATAMSIRRSPLFIPDMVFEGPSFVCARLSRPKAQNVFDQTLQKHRVHITAIPVTVGLPMGFVRISAICGEPLSYLEHTLALIADTIQN